MKVLLACLAGMSTTILERKVKEYVEENSLDIQVEAIDANTARNEIERFDMILLGPQVRFMQSAYTEAAEGKPVGIIPMQVYKAADAEEIVDLIHKLGR